MNLINEDRKIGMGTKINMQCLFTWNNYENVVHLIFYLRQMKKNNFQ